MKLTNELKPYVRNKKGQWARKTRWDFVTFGIITILLGGAYINHTHFRRSAEAKTVADLGQLQGYANVELGEEHCVKTPDGSCSFATKEMRDKWNEYRSQELEKWEGYVEGGPKEQPTEILKRVCKSNGFTDSDCPKILFAMALQESGMGKWMVGDNGKSHGFYHIMSYHNVSKSCSEDLSCSSEWTLKRMIRLGFNKSRENAIRLHNGSLKNPVTFAYLQAVKKKMALWPNG